MTSKERVTAAFKNNIPDIIPIGEFAIDFDTADKILGRETYFRNKAKTQIGYWEGRRDEVVQSWTEDSIEVYKKLDLDIAVAWLVPPRDAQFPKPKKLDSSTYELPDGTVLKYSDVTVDFTVVKDPFLEDLPKSEELEGNDFTYHDESRFAMLEGVINALGKDKYILFQWGAEEEATLALFKGYEQGLMNMIMYPDLVKKAIDHKTREANFRDHQLKKYAIDGIFMAGYDFAHSGGPFFSPAMFREMCLPSAKSRCENLHNLGYQAIKHACGNNWQLLEMFVEAGYDAYQAIQPNATMDIKKVKEQYGDKLSLWGGVDVEHLINGTPDDIISDVNYAVEHAAPGGGFILGASHSIAVGSKYDNYMAMMDQYHKVKDLYR